MINNYIHFNRDYYLAFGLEAREGRALNQRDTIDPEKILEKTHNSILNHQKALGNWAKANDLAKQLNQYYAPTTKALTGKQLTEQEYEILKKYAMEYVRSQVGRTDNLKAQFDQLRFDYADGLNPQELVGKKGELLSNENSKSIRAETIRNRLEQLKGIYATGIEPLSDIQNRVKQLEELGKELEKELENSKEKVYWLQDVKKKTVSHTANQKAIDFVQQYNDLMQTYVFTQAVSNGHLAEFMVLGILFMLQQKGNKVVKTEVMDKLMSQFTENQIKGNNSSHSIRGKDKSNKGLFQVNYAVNIAYKGDGKEKKSFAEALKEENKYLNYEVNGENGLISVKASQDKVDTKITMNGEDDLNFSIKNYQTGIHKNITLHTGNLIRLIQGQDEFINHYLNITSTRKGAGRSIKKEINEEWRRTGGSTHVDKANEIMKEYTFYKSLAGGVRTTELNKYTLEANYLVFNDSTHGWFNVIPISAFSEIFSKDNKAIIVKYNGKDALNINNTWQVNDRKSSGDKKIYSQNKAFSRMRDMTLKLFAASVHTQLAIKQLASLSRQHGQSNKMG